MFNEIKTQWENWSMSLHAERKVRSWKKIYPEIDDWTIAKLRNTYSQKNTDQLQACLVELTQNGDSNAALTLLFQLSPALKRIARNYAHCNNYEQSSNEVLSSFFQILMKHDLRKRPRKIAANLVLDTRQKISRSQRKQTQTRKAAKEQSLRPKTNSFSMYPDIERIFLLKSISETIEKNNVGSNKLLTSKIAFNYWFLGKTSKSIAVELNIKQTAVTTCLWRLRKQLKQQTELHAA